MSAAHSRQNDSTHGRFDLTTNFEAIHSKILVMFDDDYVFIKLSGLPGGVCGYEYKSHIAVDSTLLLSALGVSSIYYTF